MIKITWYKNCYKDKPEYISRFDEICSSLKRNNIEYEITDYNSSNYDLLIIEPFYYKLENYNKNACILQFSPENIRWETYSDFCISPSNIQFIDYDFNRHFTFQYNLGNLNKPKLDNSINYIDRKFCNFIYSNINRGNGTKIRVKFCEKLMEYKYVECLGKVLHNTDDIENIGRNNDWYNNKIKLLKKYKFTIAAENSIINGYTTEKLIHPFLANSIPIYIGNPDILSYGYNPKSFIIASEYNYDFNKIIERIKELDNDDNLYMSMLNEEMLIDKSKLDANIYYKRFDKFISDMCNNLKKIDCR